MTDTNAVFFAAYGEGMAAALLLSALIGKLLAKNALDLREAADLYDTAIAIIPTGSNPGGFPDLVYDHARQRLKSDRESLLPYPATPPVRPN